MKDYWRSLTDQTLREAQNCVMTQEQYDLTYADSRSRLTPQLPKPWNRSGLGPANIAGIPVVVREVGADISDVAGPVIDLRGV